MYVTCVKSNFEMVMSINLSKAHVKWSWITSVYWKSCKFSWRIIWGRWNPLRCQRNWTSCIQDNLKCQHRKVIPTCGLLGPVWILALGQICHLKCFVLEENNGHSLQSSFIFFLRKVYLEDRLLMWIMLIF